jgi:hypothetical protein
LSNFGVGDGIHHIAPLDLDRIGVGGGDVTVAGDVLVELDMHEAVFLERMHLAGLRLARFEETQGFRDRHLVDQHLTFGQRRFRNPVAGLDDRRFGCGRGRCHARGLGKERPDRDRVGGVVGTLVDHLEHIVGIR